MKKNELRIGSWLSDGKEFFQVDESFFTLLELNMQFCKPIALTEEILLKCGFEKVDFDYFILKYGNNECYFSYKKSNLELCRNMQSTANAEIKHLHQLQNLYFAITNEELIFKSVYNWTLFIYNEYKLIK